VKKFLIILLIILILAVTVFIFRDPIIDFLPIDQSGWVEQEGNRYLLDEDGDPRTGWVEHENNTFYFGDDGILHTGWLDDGENRYYFDAAGILVRGWQNLNGKQYCFNSQGVLQHGFLEENGRRFYLDEEGVPASGFFASEDKTYYIQDSGEILSGWLDTGNGSFYLHPDGALAVGLTEIDGTQYCFREDGTPYSGWFEQEGTRLFFREDGTMHTGWLEYEGLKYYLEEDGTPAVGKVVIDEKTYFFSSTGMNFIMVNPWNALPEGYALDPVYACGTMLDPACQEALEKMLADCSAAGHSPRIVSGYRSIADQRINLARMIQSYEDQGYSYNQAYYTATKIVAVPGTSEHHLGLAFDITEAAYPNLNHQQANTPTQQWLMENCWKYGFILRYPEDSTDITGIIWEPWHYRYVGTELAMEIYELGCIPLEVYIDNLTGDGSTCGGKFVPIE
jgi:glucan-binding YG repeat protein